MAHEDKDQELRRCIAAWRALPDGERRSVRAQLEGSWLDGTGFPRASAIVLGLLESIGPTSDSHAPVEPEAANTTDRNGGAQ